VGQKLNDVMVTRAIIDSYSKRLLANLELDVAIVGGGPAGLMAAYELARRKRKVAVFERNLAPGGGMWGGGLGYNLIVVQDTAKVILDKLGVQTQKYAAGYYVASSIETMGTLIVKAIRAGAAVYNLLAFEDVMITPDSRICGVVLNLRANEIARFHIDPVSISAKYVVEATGHDMAVIDKVANKCQIRLATPSGGIEGERSMNAEMGEQAVVENTVEVAPGLFVVGMAANAVMGSHRMGPIFGGMLLSGQKAGKEIHRLLGRS
jgi:thiazole biosynthesis enzyme